MGASCDTRPSLAKLFRCPHGRGADSSAFLGRPCFATGYFRFAPVAHILRTIQRDGRDSVGLRSTLAAAFGGALRAVHIPKTERGAFRLSKLAEKLPHSVFRLRRASPPIHWDFAPAGRGGRLPALVVLRGAAMPRLFDSACHDQIFIAASASRDRFEPFGLVFGEVSLASLGAVPLAASATVRVAAAWSSTKRRSKKRIKDRPWFPPRSFFFVWLGLACSGCVLSTCGFFRANGAHASERVASASLRPLANL